MANMLRRSLMTGNVRELYALNVFADLDDFDLFIEIDPQDTQKAMDIAQRAFDEWYEDEDASDTLQERIEYNLKEKGIWFSVLKGGFDD